MDEYLERIAKALERMADALEVDLDVLVKEKIAEDRLMLWKEMTGKDWVPQQENAPSEKQGKSESVPSLQSDKTTPPEKKEAPTILQNHRMGRPPKPTRKCTRCGKDRLKSDLKWNRCKDGCSERACRGCGTIGPIGVGGYCKGGCKKAKEPIITLLHSDTKKPDDLCNKVIKKIEATPEPIQEVPLDIPSHCLNCDEEHSPKGLKDGLCRKCQREDEEQSAYKNKNLNETDAMSKVKECIPFVETYIPELAKHNEITGILADIIYRFKKCGYAINSDVARKIYERYKQ
jgi:hypothetical protein